MLEVLKYLALLTALYIAWRFCRYFWHAGSPGRVSKDASILYAKIRKRRPDLTEHQMRYIAMYIASKKARDKMPTSLLSRIVSENDGKEWSSACGRFAIEYMERVGGHDFTGLAPDVRRFHYAEIGRQIDAGFQAVENGTDSLDNALVVLHAPSFLRDILDSDTSDQ